MKGKVRIFHKFEGKTLRRKTTEAAKVPMLCEMNGFDVEKGSLSLEVLVNSLYHLGTADGNS